MDVVISDAKVAVEIKSTEHVETKYKKGLKTFQEEYPDCRLLLVSLDPYHPQIWRNGTYIRHRLPEDTLER